MASFSSRFKLLREERKLTQEQLAAMLGISKGAIGNYESGQRIPRLDDLNTIAEFFEVDIDYLAGRDREMPEFNAEERWIISCFRNIPKEETKKAFKELLRQYDPIPVEKEGALLASLLNENAG